MIQTEHSNGIATPDKPNIKDVNRKDNKIEVSLSKSKDNGSAYNYYLKAIGQNTNKQITTEDNPATATITTGIDKYLVVMDDKENTNIEAKTIENIKNKKDIFDGIDVTNKTDIIYDKKIDGNFYVRPIILDVVPENKDTKLKDDVNVNLTINNITDVSEQTVLINYDSEKLYYTGFDKECDYFVLSARNIEPGKLLFKLKTNELNHKILNLHFTATDVGQAKVSVSNDSKLYLSDNSERSLLDIECGKTIINIK